MDSLREISPVEIAQRVVTKSKEDFSAEQEHSEVYNLALNCGRF